MARWDYKRFDLWLPPQVYADFKALVGSRKMSPTIRRMIEEYVRAERIRRRLEGE
jgi:hypothetical protein